MMKFIDRALALVGLGRSADIVAWTKLMRSQMAVLTDQRDAFEEKAYDINFRCEHDKEAMRATHAGEMAAASEMHAHVLDDARIRCTSELIRIHAEYAKRGLDKKSMDAHAAAQLEMDGHRAELERELADCKVAHGRVMLKLLETEKSYSLLQAAYQTARKRADVLDGREGAWQKLHGEVVRERNAISAAMKASLKNSLENTANCSHKSI